ncbi:hypothetical protein GYMLUDRAFT_244712 [Collybiopsis luxurians FD-317 M1]|uniref:Uncharacterized protein n=1 Tax=Collybiopsis luxurians FD-317 M1 TaxID=944289 RepID=A0A0D0CMQ6_9AGAR|nr:hypothetical protein GYMLUDRAFT_244712 [Collybiopsis luxurians FD-317 M1]
MSLTRSGKCFLSDDALAHLARMYHNPKFFQCHAAALGFASSSNPSLPQDDDDEEEEDWYEEDNIDFDMLPTILVYCDSELVHNWVRVDWEAGGAARVWLTLRTVAQDEIKTGVIPAMASDSVLAFLVDWTKYGKNPMLRGNLLGPLFLAAFKCIMPSPTSALEPKLQPTRSGNAEIRVMSPISYSKKGRSFKAAEWSDGMRKPQPTGGEIVRAEDDEDDDPVSDSDLVLLRQHMGDYIDSEEVDLNSKHPPASKPSNPSFLISDNEEETAEWVTKHAATSPTTGGPRKREKSSQILRLLLLSALDCCLLR